MAEKSLVALVRCEDYTPSLVSDAIQRGIDLLGGMKHFVREGESVLLKPNVLVGTSPDHAVTTHPSVFEPVGRILKGMGCSLTYGDSPGYGRPESAMRKTNLAEAAEKLGIESADFVNGIDMSYPQGHLVRRFRIAAGAAVPDAIISLPKLKAHALTRLTGAVKNQFGCVPGFLKPEFHAKLPDMDQFAQMLVDLTMFLRPRLYVMDAIVAMEGNGPRSGSPRKIGALIISSDPVAVDATACRIVNVDPLFVPTIYWGQEMGLGRHTDVELCGDPIEGFFCEDFDINRRRGSTTGRMNSLLTKFGKEWLVPRPVIDTEKCTKCGTCVKVCPSTPKAVDFRSGPDKPPSYDYSKCIRCYCCQELCPDNAISVKTPLLRRLLPR